MWDKQTPAGLIVVTYWPGRSRLINIQINDDDDSFLPFKLRLEYLRVNVN